MNRLFLAAEIGIPLIEQLVLAQSEITRHVPDPAKQLRLVEPENLHLTLQFLDDTPLETSERIQERMHRFGQGLFPFEVTLKGIGSFPDRENPRIIWAGFEPQSAELVGLVQQSVEKELEQLGISRDAREYQPHITLARCRGLIPELHNILENFADLDLGSAYVRDLVLFESELTPTGSRFTVRDRFPLGVA